MVDLQGKGTQVRPHYSIEKSEVKPGEMKCLPRVLAHETESFKNWMIWDVVRDVKESLCHVSECR